jgi:5-methylcytosine-specific restriction protein A
MGLSDVTRGAVERALSEFDELGRKAFLERYQFGKARSYFIERDGELYDSKAIAGAAHGFVSPDLEPLKPDDFSGGERTVANVLRRLGFNVINSDPRNPTWVRDELILALDFYLRFRDRLPDKASVEIADLSADINALGRRLGLAGGKTFRNPNGVYMKLMNFRRLDPQYIESGRVGLQRGGKGEEVVWAEFATDPDRLGRVATAIRGGLSVDDTEVEDGSDPDFAEAEEGRLLTRLHRSRERNRKLINRKKAAFAKTHGRLFCEACGFDFEKHYGERGAGFIECHHIKPVHTLRPGDKTRLADLRLLCANCHRMVHAKLPWLTLAELIDLLGKRH